MNPNRLAMAVIKQRQALTAQPPTGPSAAPGLLIDAPDLRLRGFQARAEVPEMSDRPNIARRSFVKGIVVLTGGATIPGLVTSMPAFGQAKATKAATQYQEKPNGQKQCSNCLQFVPGKKPKDSGTCKVVEGSISPNGYCIIWVAKP